MNHPIREHPEKQMEMRLEVKKDKNIRLRGVWTWSSLGEGWLLELDPMIRTVLREVPLNTLSHHLKGTQRPSGHPREAGEGLDSVDVRR